VATLEFLPAKDTLIVLQLSDTKVTDQSLDHLKSCSSLQRLDIHETQITPRGLLKLKHLPLHQI
jgi:hypothetical protein